jgi:hypothetical protein
MSSKLFSSIPLSISWRGVHPEGISFDPEIFGIEGHPEGDSGGEVYRYSIFRSSSAYQILIFINH